MPTIHIERNHELSGEEAARRAQDLVKELGSRLKADIAWTGSGATFKGTGFSGTAKVAEKLITLDIDLSLLLRPLKSKIEERIDRTIQKRFK